ncbi:MAG: hypothetical protein AB1635_04455 [Acidobacteriota bacterium]
MGRALHACLLLTALVAPTVPLHAADDPPAPAARSTTQVRSHPDFWFGRPRGFLGVRSSWIFQRAGSDLFDFVQRHLTLEDGAFDSPAFNVDLGVAITPRIDAVVGLETAGRTSASEYRDFVDNRLRPIEQRTTLRTTAVTGSVRVALTPRGRAISRLAWVPRRVFAFAGAGGGAAYYRFNQTGSFVDFVDRSVFDDVFESQGWAPSAHAFGGADIQVFRKLFVTVEGRYTWASGTLSTDFIGFDPIDLSGFRLSGGINVVF